MNETSHVTSCGAKGSAVERPGVYTLEHRHAGVVANLRVQLAVADVERDHSRGAALQEHVGEAAGRRAHVETVEPRDVECECVQCVRELVSRTRDVRRRRLDLERRRLVHLLTRLGVPGHATGHDQRLSLRARLGQPALDEQDVKSLLGHFHGSARRRG